MPRYFTEKITKEELADKVWAAWKEHPDFDLDEGGMAGPGCIGNDALIIDYASLTPTISSDLRKVHFDTENMTDKGYNLRPGSDEEKYMGLTTLENGLTYLGVSAGGDWEWPVFFAIYWDGKKLRGYIPEDGNPWNTDTNMAYGNDEKADVINARKRGYDVDSAGEIIARIDFRKIAKDIESRIVFKDSQQQQGHRGELELALMVGLPGCGKSTFIEKYMPDFYRVNLDSIHQWLAHGTVFDRKNIQLARQIEDLIIEDRLRQGTSVVIDNTNISSKVRSKYFQFAEKYNADVMAVYFVPDLERAISQNQQGERKVPEVAIRGMLKNYEMPTYEEGFSLIVNAYNPEALQRS